ncbi:glycoside hydrolase 43 family protein [candidate division KSB1 bacterium]|nr:glycoside hydrolase 43 family protein [candidate division KSB1 bacterium]
MILATFCFISISFSQPRTSDQGNGTYRNPIIFADYSDPDVIRVGADFYLTSSSFNCFPGLPILHSNDLVNWTIINHAIDNFPDEAFNIPQHGNGIWAPALRYHDGAYYIYYGDPDRGIYMLKTTDPAGKWDAPVLVKKAYGNIDPCPLWDDDGKVYLVHAFAHSRAGVNSLLQVNELSPDGTSVVDKGTIVFDGHKDQPTIEGPKFYKRNGYYYIFAPAGGVATGWQTVLRSKNVFGPYEEKIVLAQGKTTVNGPHQGGYVELENGDGWFVHFQEKQPYGRIVHLEPVAWRNDWPVIGADPDSDGTGEPVYSFNKPDVGSSFPVLVPQTSDEFKLAELGKQWQWQANFQLSWYSLTENPGHLRLYSQPMPSDWLDFWHVPHLLLQKMPAPEFTVTAKLKLTTKTINERAGVVVMGMDYAYIAITKKASGYNIEQVTCLQAPEDGKEFPLEILPMEMNTIFVQVRVQEGGKCAFLYSYDGEAYEPIGQTFQAKEGKWIGAKIGVFATTPANDTQGGFADFDFFRVN